MGPPSTLRPIKKRKKKKKTFKEMRVNLIFPKHNNTLNIYQNIILQLENTLLNKPLEIGIEVLIYTPVINNFGETKLDEKLNPVYEEKCHERTLKIEVDSTGDRGDRKLKPPPPIADIASPFHPGSREPEIFMLSIEIWNSKRPAERIADPPISFAIAVGPRERVKIRLKNIFCGWKKIGSKKQKILEKEFEMLCRYMSAREKFLEFLEWQYCLIYGPSRNWRFKERTGQYHFGNNNLGLRLMKKTGINLMNACSNGADGYAEVCSPLTAAFLGYWVNQQSGGAKYPTNSHAVFPKGKPFKHKAGGAFKPRPAYPDVKLENTLTGHFNNFVEKRAFVPGIKPNRKIGFKRLIWELQDRKTEFKPGTIVLTSTPGHTWFIVKFGDGFTFPCKYIFGNGVSADKEYKPDWYWKPCKEGWYLIQAQGASGYELAIRYKSHSKERLEELIEKYKIEPNKKIRWPADKVKLDNYSEQGGLYTKNETHGDIAKHLEKILEEGKRTSAEKYMLFAGTPLVWMNGMLKVELDEKMILADAIGMPVSKNKKKMYIAYTLDDSGEEIWQEFKDRTVDVLLLKDALESDYGWVKKEFGTLENNNIQCFDCRPLTFNI